MDDVGPRSTDALAEVVPLRRPRTIPLRRLKRGRENIAEEELLALEAARPRTRDDCRGGPRPCPFVSCRYHLFLDVNPGNGSVKLNYPGRGVSDLDETCSLDVADRDGMTLEAIGMLLNVTRERIRQLERNGLSHLLGQLDR